MEEKELKISKRKEQEDNLWKGVKSVKISEQTHDTEKKVFIPI